MKLGIDPSLFHHHLLPDERVSRQQDQINWNSDRVRFLLQAEPCRAEVNSVNGMSVTQLKLDVCL